ncbi:Na(+)/H(+) antiporter subunit D [Caloramator mitchellensis]|uniref:Na(+)/H(+) antiporter subunit D n=1 Tax=Caloramator mitchellensis TaxID=908809 RepID=A0A0R3JUA4_CALMK|nr:proton-conducting transporter membrane subunit [Caloramator mitchellensis]KRQ86602.1 Na(+)/H(+) antiporter subunit D [Caloramator mitchellensis]
MQHYPILSIVVLFLGAFLTVIFGSKNDAVRKFIATISSGISLVLVLLLIKPIMIEGNVINYWLGNWRPVHDWAIGIGLEVDALGLFFGIIVVLTVFLSTLFSYSYIKKDVEKDKYYVLFQMLAGSVLGLVFTGDLFNMFVMIEIMTFAAVGLTAFRNYQEGALEAALKYLVLGSIGSSLVLAGTITIYSQVHTLNMAQISALLFNNLTPSALFAFALLLAGFSLKAFVVPFHPAAPDAYMAAPSSISMAFSGMVNKAGVYAILRLVYVLFHSMDLKSMQMLLIVIGTITMFVGVTMALAQNDFKRLLAFHSISQIGYVITGIGLSTALGLTGGLYHALNHTLFKGLLFLSAGAVFFATGTTDLNKLGGLAKKMPQTAAIFLIGAFSISGLPPFNGFVSKWLIYQATYQANMAIVTIIALLVSVMTLASFIKVAQSVFFGQMPEEFKDVKEVPLSMRIPMWIMAILCIITGIMPQFVTKYLINPAVSAVLNIGNYIDTMMGSGYAQKIIGEPVQIPQVDYTLAGYWNPIAWLVLFGLLLIAVALVALAGGFNHQSIPVEEDNPKYDVFFSGEANEFSHVKGNDLFWGLKHDLRHYFGFMHDAHSGVINDYALWAIFTTSIFIIYIFLLVP